MENSKHELNTRDRVADRAQINRANAQKSTGPRSNSGKQRSKLNALRHGLTGQTIVLPTEDLTAYQRHSQSFLDEYQPKGATEAQLVQSLIDTSWRLNRIATIETNLFSLGLTEHAGEINTERPEVHDALAMAAAFRKHNRTFANLSIYAQRLNRDFDRTLQQLRQLQAERRDTEARQLAEAARMLKLHRAEEPEEQPTPYNPAEDGFVFSVPEIEAYTRRRKRVDRANDLAFGGLSECA